MVGKNVLQAYFLLVSYCRVVAQVKPGDYFTRRERSREDRRTAGRSLGEIFTDGIGTYVVLKANDEGDLCVERIDMPATWNIHDPDIVAAQIRAGIAKEGAIISSMAGNYFRFSEKENCWKPVNVGVCGNQVQYEQLSFGWPEA